MIDSGPVLEMPPPMLAVLPSRTALMSDRVPSFSTPPPEADDIPLGDRDALQGGRRTDGDIDDLLPPPLSVTTPPPGRSIATGWAVGSSSVPRVRVMIWGVPNAPLMLKTRVLGAVGSRDGRSSRGCRSC